MCEIYPLQDQGLDNAQQFLINPLRRIDDKKLVEDLLAVAVQEVILVLIELLLEQGEGFDDGLGVGRGRDEVVEGVSEEGECQGFVGLFNKDTQDKSKLLLLCLRPCLFIDLFDKNLYFMAHLLLFEGRLQSDHSYHYLNRWILYGHKAVPAPPIVLLVKIILTIIIFPPVKNRHYPRCYLEHSRLSRIKHPIQKKVVKKRPLRLKRLPIWLNQYPKQILIELPIKQT